MATATLPSASHRSSNAICSPDPTMRVLLVAYEFPPSPSPQSLRWAYLSRELARLGHDVHVMAPDLPEGPGGLPPLPPEVVVHRCFAGPLMGLLAWRDRRARHSVGVPAGPVVEPAMQSEAARTDMALSSEQTQLNWKGRLFERVKKAVTRGGMFPDSRAEWNPWARRKLRRLCVELRPDALIVSHEPANTVQLGLAATRRMRIPLIADMGDPILAPYTPAQWRRRAFELEAEVCEKAAHITVTCEQARQLLHERHRLPLGRCTVVTQGFDPDVAVAPTPAPDESLTLLYTGSFYSFRRSDALLEAVAAVPGLRLDIASVVVPDHVAAAAEAAPERIRLLGFLRHNEVLQRQRASDVLINISNADAVQVPGKLYEYLGAGRPILHLGDGSDPSGRLVELLRRGWSSPNEAEALRMLLARLVETRQAGTLCAGLDLSMDPVERFSWRAQAATFDGALRNAVPSKGRSDGSPSMRAQVFG